MLINFLRNKMVENLFFYLRQLTSEKFYSISSTAIIAVQISLYYNANTFIIDPGKGSKKGRK